MALADPARDQLCVLRTEVNDQYRVKRTSSGHVHRLSTREYPSLSAAREAKRSGARGCGSVYSAVVSRRRYCGAERRASGESARGPAVSWDPAGEPDSTAGARGGGGSGGLVCTPRKTEPD